MALDVNTSGQNYNWHVKEEGQVDKSTIDDQIYAQFITDTIQTDETQPLLLHNYNNGAHLPKLVLPSTLRESDPSSLYKNSDFHESLRNVQYNMAFDDELNQLAKSRGLSPQQIKQIRYAHLYPDAKGIPQDIKDLAQLAEKQTLGTLLSKKAVPQGWEPNPSKDRALLSSQASNSLASKFEAAMNKMGLSEEQKTALRFQFYSQNSVTTPPAASNDLFSQLMEEALKSVQEDFGIPDGTEVSIPNGHFNQKLTDAYTKSFEDTLAKYAKDNHLSETDINQLRFFHYNGGGDYPPDVQAKLKTINDQLEKTATAAIQKQFGFPDDYHPPVDNSIFNADINGTYRYKLNKKLQQKDNPNPSKAEIMADAKESLTEVRTEFATPPNWIPRLFGQGLPTQTKIIAHASLAFGTEIVENAIKLYQQQFESPPPDQPQNKDQNKTVITDGSHNKKVVLNAKSFQPTGDTILDLLKVIHEALDKLNLQIYKIEEAQTQSSQNEVKAQMEAQQDQIKMQAEKQAELAKQQKKQKQMNDVMKILGPCMEALSIAMAIVMGPLALAIAIFLVVDAEMHPNGNTFISQMFKEITTGVTDGMKQVLPPDSPAAAKFDDLVSQWVRFAVVVAILTVGITYGGGMAAIDLGMTCLQSSNIIQDFVATCGGDAEVQQYTALAVMLALTLAICVVGIAAGGESSAVEGVEEGANAAKTVQTSTKVAVEAEKIVADVESVMNKIGEFSQKLQDIIEDSTVGLRSSAAATKTVKAVEEAGQEAAQALARIAAKMNQVKTEAEEALKTAMGQMKKLLQALLKQIENMQNVVGKAADDVGSIIKDSRPVTQIVRGASKVDDLTQPLQKALKNFTKALDDLMKALSDSRAVQTVGKGVSRAGRGVKSVLSKLLPKTKAEAAMQVFNLVSTGLQVGTGGVNLVIQLDLAKIALIQGDLDAFLEQITTLIALFEKMSQKIIDSQAGLAEWSAQVTALNSKMWQESSATISHIFSKQKQGAV